MALNILQDTQVQGTLSFGDEATVSNFPANNLTNSSISATAAIARSKLAQDTYQPYVIKLQDLRVWDDVTEWLPNASANDDLAIVDGTFGTDAYTMSAGDVKGVGAVTRYARGTVALPAEYDDGASVRFRIRAAMETTVADTSATVDVEAYLLDEDGTLNGSPTDLVSNAALSINSLTVANYDFELATTSLVSGSEIDFRVTVACNDGASVTVVRPSIYKVTLLCDIKG
jgi:hypothetical protein